MILRTMGMAIKILSIDGKILLQMHKHHGLDDDKSF